MRLAMVIVALLLTAGAARAAQPATAPAERFIGKDTVLAAEVDLSEADADELVRWGSDVVLAVTVTDAEALAPARAHAAGLRAQVVRWMNDFRAAAGGAPPIVGVTESSWLLDARLAVYVQVPPGGDAERVELVFGGGPEARKRKAGQPRFRGDWMGDVKIWPGRVVGYSGGAHSEPPAPGRPRRRDFAQALAAGGAGAAATAPAARVAIVPDQKLRDTCAQSLPAAAWPFVEPMTWLAIRYDAAPLPLKTPATLTATFRARDVAAAATVAAAWTALIDTTYTAAGLEPAAVQQVVHQLTPTIEGDRLVLSIAADELPRLIADARPGIRDAWRKSGPAAAAANAARRDPGSGTRDARAEVAIPWTPVP